MPRFTNLPDHLREHHEIRSSDVPSFYWMAMGIAVLIGLVSGLIWIAWNLLKLHVLQ
jgi:hypothetical protein